MELIIKQANQLQQDGKMQKAIDCYDKNIQEQNDEKILRQCYFHKALVLSNLQKYEESNECYMEAIKIKEHSDAYANFGYNLLVQGKLEEAIYAYKNAIKLKPKSYDYHLNLGNVYHRLNMYKNAILAYDDAIQINSSDADCYINKGSALLQLNLFNQALECFDQAIEINQNDSEAYNGQGICLSHLNRYEQAEKAFEKASILDKNEIKFKFNLANSLLQQNNLGLAEKLIDECIQFNPQDPEFLIKKAVLLQLSHNHNEAKNSLNKAIQIDPFHAQAIKLLKKIQVNSIEIQQISFEIQSNQQKTKKNVQFQVNEKDAKNQKQKVPRLNKKPETLLEQINQEQDVQELVQNLNQNYQVSVIQEPIENKIIKQSNKDNSIQQQIPQNKISVNNSKVPSNKQDQKDKIKQNPKKSCNCSIF